MADRAFRSHVVGGGRRRATTSDFRPYGPAGTSHAPGRRRPRPRRPERARRAPGDVVERGVTSYPEREVARNGKSRADRSAGVEPLPPVIAPHPFPRRAGAATYRPTGIRRDPRGPWRRLSGTQASAGRLILGGPPIAALQSSRNPAGTVPAGPRDRIAPRQFEAPGTGPSRSDGTHLQRRRAPPRSRSNRRTPASRLGGGERMSPRRSNARRGGS